MRVLSTLAVLLLASLCTAISTISAKGSKFFTSDGNQWFIKGVAYQLTSDDPLIDNNQCSMDADLMQTLGANTIRVYHVDPDGQHKPCMDTFAAKGIYLFVDLDTFNTAISQDDPMWNQTQLSAFEKVMDEFQQYDNTAGFFVGNEVLTTGNGSVAAPYVKAAIRDTKAYRDKKKYRTIPIGYSAADIATLRPMLQNYLACGSKPEEAADFYSLNAYEWCGSASSYEISGYSQLTANVTDYNIPIFFSETGCNTSPPRDFADQAAVFGPEMSPYWSGAIIYEWVEEANNYGLVSYGTKVNPSSPSAPPDGYPRSGSPTPVSPDFSNLSKQWATLTPNGTSEAQYTATNTAPPCPAYTTGAWDVNGDVALPTLGATFDAQASASLAGTNAPGGADTNGTGTATGSAGAATSSAAAASPLDKPVPAIFSMLGGWVAFVGLLGAVVVLA